MRVEFERVNINKDANTPILYRSNNKRYDFYWDDNLFGYLIEEGFENNPDLTKNFYKFYIPLINEDSTNPEFIALDENDPDLLEDDLLTLSIWQFINRDGASRCLPRKLYRSYFNDGNPTSVRYGDREVINWRSQPLLEPLQVIKFGPPGTGKSYSVLQEIKTHNCRSIIKSRSDDSIITTVFHPDYSYGDFTAKLVPVTVDGNVEYQIHAGPFAKAVARAIYQPNEPVYLVVEEINRGNTAAIFGDVFQLLDRNEEGESEYPITIQKLLHDAITLETLELKAKDQVTDEDNQNESESSSTINSPFRLPKNLSIIATMNTSDESVFYMDSAFKRRWHFDYVDVDTSSQLYDVEENKEDHPLHNQITAKIYGAECEWDKFRKELNKFIKAHSYYIRRIEDKLIGLWFIKAKNGEISDGEIKNKLMHYLWDNVFARDKKPLIDKIDQKEIITFGDFVDHYDAFVEAFCQANNTISQE